jgi:hypothetical protein
MRIFAALALVPALMLAAPDSARACGPGEGGQVDFIAPEEDDTASVILARARELDRRAVENDREAAQADRRARTLLAKARQVQQRAVLREGVELTSMLENARQLAMQSNEAKAHAGRARARAANFRAQARNLRRQAFDVQADFQEPRPRQRQRRVSAFAL